MQLSRSSSNLSSYTRNTKHNGGQAEQATDPDRLEESPMEMVQKDQELLESDTVDRGRLCSQAGCKTQESLESTSRPRSNSDRCISTEVADPRAVSLPTIASAEEVRSRQSDG